jgi:hypothetical protein
MPAPEGAWQRTAAEAAAGCALWPFRACSLPCGFSRRPLWNRSFLTSGAPLPIIGLLAPVIA